MRKKIPARKHEIAEELAANEREFRAAFDKFTDLSDANMPAQVERRLLKKMETLDARYDEVVETQPELVLLERLEVLFKSALRQVQRAREARQGVDGHRTPKRSRAGLISLGNFSGFRQSGGKWP